MLNHVVLFWLREDLTETERAAFRTGVETLREIEDAEAVYVGAPAPTPARPVVDQSYSIGLTVLLKDLAAHDRYQDHAIHQAFVDAFKPYWDRVLIYDFE